jgi:hypothetical protein
MGWFAGYLLIPGLVFNLAHYLLATAVRLVLAAGVGGLFLLCVSHRNGHRLPVQELWMAALTNLNVNAQLMEAELQQLRGKRN